MRVVYDLYIEAIGQSAERESYRKYATLFHRAIPWEEKQKLLPRKLTPVGE